MGRDREDRIGHGAQPALLADAHDAVIRENMKLYPELQVQCASFVASRCIHSLFVCEIMQHEKFTTAVHDGCSLWDGIGREVAPLIYDLPQYHSSACYHCWLCHRDAGYVILIAVVTMKAVLPRLHRRRLRPRFIRMFVCDSIWWDCFLNVPSGDLRDHSSSNRIVRSSSGRVGQVLHEYIRVPVY